MTAIAIYLIIHAILIYKDSSHSVSELSNDLKIIDYRTRLIESKPDVVPKDGYTPIKGIDYRDGIDGKKGEKGDKGERGEKGDKGEKGEKGDTIIPELRCNYFKNRWEVRYINKGTGEITGWEILNNHALPCMVLSSI